MMVVGEMSNTELMNRLLESCQEERRLIADFIEFLIEVDRRRLDLVMSCTSLHDFCVRRLKMSGGTAYRRINAARLVQRYPFLLEKIASGELHLSGLVILRDHLTDANATELASAASGRSESELYELLATLSPRPDVPERVSAFWGSSRTEPLSPTSYLVQLTVSAATHEKLLEARDLLRHLIPDGNLAAVVDHALDLVLRRKRAPRARVREVEPASASTAKVSEAVRREVFERDGYQCTYRSADGERCPARSLLEIDHENARARGGENVASNLRVLCKPHNLLHAQETFGKPFVAEKIAARRARKSVAGQKVHDTARESHEQRAVEGLTRLGYPRRSCARTVRSILDRGQTVDLVALMQEAIGVLASTPPPVRPRPTSPLSEPELRASG